MRNEDYHNSTLVSNWYMISYLVWIEKMASFKVRQQRIHSLVTMVIGDEWRFNHESHPMQK